MLTEIAQIKRFLAKAHNMPLENPDSDLMIRVVGEDGEHMIPLGVTLTPTRVVIKDGAIHVDPQGS